MRIRIGNGVEVKNRTNKYKYNNKNNTRIGNYILTMYIWNKDLHSKKLLGMYKGVTIYSL